MMEAVCITLSGSGRPQGGITAGLYPSDVSSSFDYQLMNPWLPRSLVLYRKEPIDYEPSEHHPQALPPKAGCTAPWATEKWKSVVFRLYFFPCSPVVLSRILRTLYRILCHSWSWNGSSVSSNHFQTIVLYLSAPFVTK